MNSFALTGATGMEIDSDSGGKMVEGSYCDECEPNMSSQMCVEKKMRLIDGSASPTRCVSFASDRGSVRGESRHVRFAEEPTVHVFEQDDQEIAEQAEWVSFLTQRYIFNHICCHLEKEHKIWDRLDTPQGHVIEEAWYRYTDMVQQRLTSTGALDTFARRFAEVRASRKAGGAEPDASPSSHVAQISAAAAPLDSRSGNVADGRKQKAQPKDLTLLQMSQQSQWRLQQQQQRLQQDTQAAQLSQSQQQSGQRPPAGLTSPPSSWQFHPTTVVPTNSPPLTFLAQPAIQKVDIRGGWGATDTTQLHPANNYIKVNRGQSTNIQYAPQSMARFTYANGVQVVVQTPAPTSSSMSDATETGVDRPTGSTEHRLKLRSILPSTEDRSVTSGDTISCRTYAVSSPVRVQGLAGPAIAGNATV